MHDFNLTIDGRAYRTAARFDVINPATGKPAGTAPNATAADLDAAVAAAKAAFATWSQTSDADRQAACGAVAAVLGDHAEELAALITAEQGKPLNGLGSRWEMGGAQAWAGFTAGLSVPVKVIQDDNAGRVELHRKPLGVVGSITPWNFPVMIAVWHILPALRTGNTVVIKPSPLTPLATLRAVELMNTVLPAGVVNIVTGDDTAVNLGAAMSAHPDIRKIVFTGSCATGQKVMQSAAATMKRLTLELGGNDAGIVLPDADPAAIAEGLFWGAFINNGQTCAAMKRLYVHDSIHDAVCDALVAYASKIPVGNGTEEGSVLGPIQNRMQFDKVARLVADGAARGKVLLGGAPGEGLFFPPTIIAGLRNGDPLVDEEQFGPALPVIRYTDLDEVIAAANDSPNGLGGSIWTSDLEKGRKLALRMECGSVWINKHGAIQPNVPFGGVKASGLGVEFSDEGLAEYTDLQAVFS
ncbi:aldehyde dehydrogenase family protein [Rhodobacteraceae bacterium HSP-20]|uniref:Aldehyde dehydrogenase family protein n=1 Tax=Paragemmobacter amnigenus TaxID=2852097 RepID=A0ABS6J1I3_9RHOB|nr:aldehyde dehydrogenase family protein [Rhodobacter amnigenus]MBU9697613.1 aldehyde dehydrogenase family protein [Rhodobacter amnigenus]MBV4388840.1 aldehyde dehydrogenase family protein [Rhodobacter amnigenus]